MKAHLVAICSLGIMIASCRTTSPRHNSLFKYAPGCDPKGFLSELHPGGLFASKRLVYNQVQVQRGVIHPDMTEIEETGSMGLFHTYGAVREAASVVKAMQDIQNQALQAIYREPRMIDSQSVAFEGVDPSLNVFSIDGAKVLKLTSLRIDVPSGSSVVIIIRGESPAFTSAKLSGTFSPEKLLFILPEAKYFQIRGDKFSGTVIAPQANVNVDVKFEGSVFGENVRSMYVTRPFMYAGCIFGSNHLKK